jgi:hypothetical protein
VPKEEGDVLQEKSPNLQVLRDPGLPSVPCPYPVPLFEKDDIDVCYGVDMKCPLRGSCVEGLVPQMADSIFET